MRLGSVAHAHLIGLTCELKGPREQDAFTETEYGVTARRRPDAPHASSDTTEAGSRRVPPLVACDGRAVSAEKSRYQQHVVSYNPERKLSLEATEASRESSQRVRKTNTPLSSVRRPMGES